MPSACVIESDQPNAFGTGRNPENAAVAATSGLQRLLSEQELAGVVAHELAHIHDRETLVVTTMAAIAGAVSMLANFGLFFDGNRNKPLGLAGPILAMLLAQLAAMLVQAAISCTREFAADKDGAATCGHPIRLDRALERLDEYAARTRNVPAESIPVTAYLLVVNPLRGSSVRTVFSTHPRTEDRVHRLRSIAGTVRPSFGGSRFLFVSASCRATARRAREALVWKDRQPSRGIGVLRTARSPPSGQPDCEPSEDFHAPFRLAGQPHRLTDCLSMLAFGGLRNWREKGTCG